MNDLKVQDSKSMERYSSNLTLFYVVFFPVFWWVFFGLAVIISFIAPLLYDDLYVNYYVKYVSLIMLIVGTLWIYFFTSKLKRFEANDHEIYITNYFKHIKMPITAIDSVKIYDFWILRLVKLKFNFKSQLGHSIMFLERENLFETFCNTHQIPLTK